MKNKSVTVVIILMFALALGAGVVAGKLSNRLPTKEAPIAERGTLSDVLKLSPDQRARMESIWEGVRDTSRDCIAQAQRAQHAQDDDLMAILNDDQKKKYAEMTQATAGKIAVLDARRKAAFKKAVDDTNGILNESQRKTYEQIIRDRVGELPDSGWERP